MKLCMFRTVPLSIIRGLHCAHSNGVCHTDLLTACGQVILLASNQQICITYTIAVCTVKTPDDGQKNCPKHAKCHSKNKFEKLVHVVGFIIRNLSRCTGHMNVKCFGQLTIISYLHCMHLIPSFVQIVSWWSIAETCRQDKNKIKYVFVFDWYQKKFLCLFRLRYLPNASNTCFIWKAQGKEHRINP